MANVFHAGEKKRLDQEKQKSKLFDDNIGPIVNRRKNIRRRWKDVSTALSGSNTWVIEFLIFVGKISVNRN